MNFREMRARLIGSYGRFVFFPDDLEIPKIISRKAFTHLIVDGERVTVYSQRAMKDEIESMEENYEIEYGAPKFEGKYYVSPYTRVSNLNFQWENGMVILREAMRKPFPEEIEILITLGESIQNALNRFFQEIELGMSEEEMKSILECKLLKSGVDGFLYPSIVISGKRSKWIVPRSTREKISSGKIVYIDSTPTKEGYPLSFSRVILTEERKEWIESIERINRMYEALYHTVKSGMRCDYLDAQIRRVGEFPHYSVVPAGGFYQPYAPSDCILEEGMVMTIVPSIYLDEGVIRIKRNVLVEKDTMKFLD